MKHKTAITFSLFLTQRSLLSLFLLAIISSNMDAKENLAIFDPMDVFDLEWGSDPRVSPDGETIVYVRRSNDIMKDRERSNLWQVSSNGDDHRPLYSRLKSARTPRWAPDGKSLHSFPMIVAPNRSCPLG